MATQRTMYTGTPRPRLRQCGFRAAPVNVSASTFSSPEVLPKISAGGEESDNTSPLTKRAQQGPSLYNADAARAGLLC